MISRTEAETVAEAAAVYTPVAAPEYEPMSESEKAKLENNPWRVNGLMRYEEKDLAYADRKVVEAAQMTDPEEQRRHLQDVIELFAAKYFMEFTVEGLLQDADLDLVYVHKMLAESVDEDSDEEAIDYKVFMAEYWKEHGNDDEL